MKSIEHQEKVLLPYPISANVYWRVSGSRVYVSDKAIKYKQDVGYLYTNKIIHGVVRINMELHPKTNKDGSASKVRIDLDNALKVTIDALKNIAFDDDKCIVEINARVGHPIKNGGISVYCYKFRE